MAKILKGIGGFYYVKCDDSDDIIECKARGKFRNLSVKPYVGDDVDIELSLDESGKGSILNIHDRKNCFIRPPVANIDRLVIVCSCHNPEPDYGFVDKMLVICASKNVDAIICLNKTDLATEAEIMEFSKVYEKIGVPVITTSNIDEVGIDKLKEKIYGKITAFSGFSGVGKSTLLNNILGTKSLQTGEVSKKIGRGRHTTRHVELMEFGDGYLVDTPGFGSLEILDIDADDLKQYFPEFEQFECNCRFPNCMHLGTKFCGVYDAVCSGKIPESRFENYKSFYKLLKDKKEW